jgi:CDGSH-type Zn-finger protein
MTERSRVRVMPNGPVLVPGPVRIETPDRVVDSDRFMVAICTCRRSKNYPLCDTSHRRCGANPTQPGDNADRLRPEVGAAPAAKRRGGEPGCQTKSNGRRKDV